MAKRRTARQKSREEKRRAKLHRINNPGQSSSCARKVRYLNKNGLWGFEVPEPKPWRRAS